MGTFTFTAGITRGSGRGSTTGTDLERRSVLRGGRSAGMTWITSDRADPAGRLVQPIGHRTSCRRIAQRSIHRGVCRADSLCPRLQEPDCRPVPSATGRLPTDRLLRTSRCARCTPIDSIHDSKSNGDSRDRGTHWVCQRIVCSADQPCARPEEASAGGDRLRSRLPPEELLAGEQDQNPELPVEAVAFTGEHHGRRLWPETWRLHRPDRQDRENSPHLPAAWLEAPLLSRSLPARPVGCAAVCTCRRPSGSDTFLTLCKSMLVNGLRDRAAGRNAGPASAGPVPGLRNPCIPQRPKLA